MVEKMVELQKKTINARLLTPSQHNCVISISQHRAGSIATLCTDLGRYVIRLTFLAANT